MKEKVIPQSLTVEAQKLRFKKKKNGKHKQQNKDIWILNIVKLQPSFNMLN